MKNSSIVIIMAAFAFSAFSKIFAQNPGDVIFNEVMYDPKDENEEWIELFNTTNADIDISNWILTDDDTYPTLSGEGKLPIPEGTTIPAGGFVVLCYNAIADITGETICVKGSSFALGNSGDNLALYTAASGGTLIDGSLTANYPDEAGDGESLEKIDPSIGWTGSGDDWAKSSNNFGGTNHVYCTPGSANSVWETTPPSDVSNISASNPTDNSINLCWNNPADVDFTGTLILRKADSAPTGSPVGHTTYSIGTSIGDGIIVYIGDGSSHIDTGLDPNTIYFYKAFSYDEVRNYATGVLANESTIAVELALFNASLIDGKVVLNWITQTETENLGFHIYRSVVMNGEFARITTELIKGGGSSDQAHGYSCTDSDVKLGATYYYKLADVDFSGNMKFHGPISVTMEAVPSNYSLEQNYPNPFNPETAINFSIKEAGKVTLKIYNLQGQVVRTLVEEEKPNGSYSVMWNGTDEKGLKVSAGTYLYILQVNGFEQIKKLVFMK